MTAERMRVVLAGSTPNIRAALRVLQAEHVEVVAVVAAPPDGSPLVGTDAACGLPVFGPDDIAGGPPPRLRTASAEVLVSFQYARLLPPALYESCALAVNFHPAPLPQLRGMHVIPYAVATGMTTYGVSTHHLSPRFDEGDLIRTRPVRVQRADTAGSLFHRASKASLHELSWLVREVGRVGIDALPRSPQSAGTLVTRARLVEAIRLDPADDDETLGRKLRATSWDGVGADVFGERVPLADAVQTARRRLASMALDPKIFVPTKG